MTVTGHFSSPNPGGLYVTLLVTGPAVLTAPTLKTGLGTGGTSSVFDAPAPAELDYGLLLTGPAVLSSPALLTGRTRALAGIDPPSPAGAFDPPNPT